MIIRSKSENDVYKWNMSYLMMMKFPNMKVRFKFKNRRPGEKFDQKFIEEMKLELAKLRTLKLSNLEKNFMKKNFWWIPGWYFDWYQNADIFRPEAVKMWLDENSEFQCEVEDYGYIVTFWETNILPIFSELRNRAYGYTYDKMNESEALELVREQINLSNEHQLKFSEFGLRRRFSAAWQDKVDDIIAKEAKFCVGNSNVYEAIRLGQKISGTQAHEIYMAYNAIYGYREGNYKCVKDWMEVFNGHAGILLGDTIGLDAFLKCLTTLYAKASGGYRHDSGPWEVATTKYIKRLNELHVNPMHKSIIYSNSINMWDLDDIGNNVRGRVGDFAGGIGGALTNNIPNLKPANPNIVMKSDMVQLDANSFPANTVKVPDEEGKAMGDPVEIDYCKYVTGRKK